MGWFLQKNKPGMVKYVKILSIATAFIAVNSTDICAQGSPQRKQLFDSDWKFFLGDIQEASEINFDDKNWRNLDLPHDWSIEGKPDPINPTGRDGGYFPAGEGWYRKTFTIPASWKGKCISIYFEGVYMNSEVFINGKSLGIHPYGYTSFRYDLTSDLAFGSENVLSVKVDNSKQKNCRWYSGSGIYRHVWMEVTEPVYVAGWGVSVSTPDVSPEKATVNIKIQVKNETDLPQAIILNTKLLGADNKKIGENKTAIELTAKCMKEVEQSFQVFNPLLWSPEQPHLYQAQVQILTDNHVLDDTKTTFGIRSIKFTAENGFQLNGKTVKINGGCVHHDNGCLGAAAFDRAEERRVELLKSAGFNAIRTSHNPPSEAFLDACDRLGMIVIDEVFDGWKERKTDYDYALYFETWWQRDVESMVLRDRNHPSIIMWSTGNEIIERKKPEAVETATMLANCVRRIDPTRPVTSAMTTWDSEWEIFDPLFATHDIGGYNYQLHRAVSDHERVPSRIMVQTESFPRDAFANWKLVKDNDYIIGDFVWTALDYLGESGIGRYYYPEETPGEHWEGEFFPWHGAYCGDIDLTGWRKPISHYRGMLYDTGEKLYMAVREPNPDSGKIKETLWSVWPTWESWTWPGYEGKDLQVEVYSRYPKVRLYLNENIIGEQATIEETQFKATFNVPYSPGVLSAVGVLDDGVTEPVILKTAHDPSCIKLIADRTRLMADGQALSFVTVEITDKEGNLQPNAENLLQFSIDGPGLISGVDNANLKDTDPYAGKSRRAWHGRALVVIRSTKTAGEIHLTVSSPGLADASLIIETLTK
jgi:beta-galactosidase